MQQIWLPHRAAKENNLLWLLLYNSTATQKWRYEQHLHFVTINSAIGKLEKKNFILSGNARWFNGFGDGIFTILRYVTPLRPRPPEPRHTLLADQLQLGNNKRLLGDTPRFGTLEHLNLQIPLSLPTSRGQAQWYSRLP